MPEDHIPAASLYILICIIGFIGNGLVLCILITYRSSWKCVDRCFFNIVLSDLFFLASLPFWAYNTITYKWVFGNFMCHFITALYMLGIHGSIFFMVLMIIDRYANILECRYRNITQIRIIPLFVWLLSFFASLPRAILTQEIKDHFMSTTFCTLDYLRPARGAFTFLTLNFTTFIIPLAIMVFCMSHMFFELSRARYQRKPDVYRPLLGVVIVYFLCWTPFNIGVFLTFLETQHYLVTSGWLHNLDLAMPWLEIIAFSHCCLNPIIYTFVAHGFKRTTIRLLKDRFPVCCRKCTHFSEELEDNTGISSSL